MVAKGKFVAILFLIGVGAAVALAAELGTAFTYQGQLTFNGTPFTGTANLCFELYDDPSAGTRLSFYPAPLGTTVSVSVTNGLFTRDDIDFGQNAFTGEARWLQVYVNGAAITPRQKLTPAPYGLYSAGPWATGAGGALSYTNGNVGIGTSDPSSLLDVRDSGSGERTILTLRTAESIVGTAGRLDWAQSGTVTGRVTNCFEGPGLAGLAFHTYSDGLEPRLGERMRITGHGNVGIGTPTPQAKLDIEGHADPYQGSNALLLLRKNSATAIGSDGGLVFQIQNDLGQYGNYNTAGVFDVYEGGNRHALALRATASGERTMNTVAYFRGDGNVGIGTTTPQAPLDIQGHADPYQGSNTLLLLQKNVATPIGSDAGLVFQIQNDLGQYGNYNTAGVFDVYEGGNRHALALRATASGQSTMNTVAYFRGDGNVGIGTLTPGERLEVNGNVLASGYMTSSDQRFKNNVRPLSNALALVEKLRSVRFDWKCDEFPDRQFSAQPALGLIAQEVREVIPEVVQAGSDGYLSVDYGRLTPVLIQALHELKAEKDAEIGQLRTENAELRARLDRLERLLTARATEPGADR